MTKAPGNDPLPPEALEEIHEATLAILEDVGVRIEHEGVAARLLEAGAKPGSGAGDVRFPRRMVGERLALAPSSFELAARDGTTTVLSPDCPPCFWTVPCLSIQEGTSCRPVTSSDLARIARLSGALENVQAVLGVAMDDVPPAARDFTGLRVIAENCRKHARVLCFSGRGMEALAEMKRLFPGPWFSMGFTAHGPLRWTRLSLEIFAASAGHGIPTTVNGEPMAGVTGPVTLAGSIAVGNAEILSGIVVNQVLEPGRPVIYNLGLAHIMDMRHATVVTGGAENALFAKASAALGRFYRLPSSSWVSTESVFEDGQAALEKMLGFQTHIAAGVGVIWGVGQLESEKTISLAQMVIDDEMVAACLRYARGFTVDRERLCPDLVREVGIAGSYLETGHTLAHHREELHAPGVLNRRPREQCPAPLEEVARARADELIAGRPPEPIDETVRRELLRIEKAFSRQC